MLGPTGTGKSLHGRSITQKLGIFHIRFRDRLQELVVNKTKRLIGGEYDDEQDDVFSEIDLYAILYLNYIFIISAYLL